MPTRDGGLGAPPHFPFLQRISEGSHPDWRWTAVRLRWTPRTFFSPPFRFSALSLPLLVELEITTLQPKRSFAKLVHVPRPRNAPKLTVVLARKVQPNERINVVGPGTPVEVYLSLQGLKVTSCSVQRITLSLSQRTDLPPGTLVCLCRSTL